MNDTVKEYDAKMQKTVDVVVNEFAAVRAGRANAAVLDRISVDYYGTATPLQQVGSISSPDPRTLLIQPWDSPEGHRKGDPELRPGHQPPERRQGHPPWVPAADGGTPQGTF
jgi:ABC-type amino acid transport substrate-binding protein